ncbi:MAG: endonuclease/exonuclease/phosphatase family protein [Archangium sp.]|nr:endonuclease/exonuclease/phosphatase family protein [Archangium sp.]MDP3157496.1 endonuclease/exonuclease/phosphatase family protein [Archangium sp.]MDP3572783.1 endonuclease/exonuclease/phosphatase family protein [Archangium sp.]
MLQSPVRIVSYNVRYFGHGLKGLASTAASKSRIATALCNLDPLPDLVALQEVETQSLRAGVAHRGAHPAENQLEAFLRHLGDEFKRRGLVMPYRAWYFPAHVYQLGSIKLYTTGLAMLVNSQKLEVIADNGHRPHPITHHRNESLKKVKQTRIAAHLRLEDLQGRRFHLFNTHLSLPTPWAKEFWSQPGKMGFGQNQIAEAKAVAQYAQVTAHDEPYLVVGDFNTAPMTPVYRYLTEEAKLRGAQEQLKQIDASRSQSFATAGFMHLRMHLDHLFASGDLGFIDLKDTCTFGDRTSPFSGLSDHVPLIANFDLG